MFLNILLFLLLFLCKGEEPKRSCDPVTPFKKLDLTCGSFADICVKTNDEDCDYFQKACKQCPPTNYTVFMLSDIKSQISRSNIILDWIKNQMNISISRINVSLDIIEKKATNQVDMVIACLFFIILNTLGICIFFIEIRTCRYLSSRDKHRIYSNNETMRLLNKNPQDIEEARTALINIQQIVHQDNTKLLEEVKKIIHKNDITKLLENVKKMINEKEYSALDSVVSHKLKFQIANQFDETELFVSKYDNIMKLKKSICDRNMNMNDYKRMIMKYKDVTLDNNQYLLSCIDSTNIPIFCEFDNNIDVNAMIVIKLKCDNIYPEMLQIWKHQQIKDLKTIISELNKTYHENLLIVYKSTQLDDDDKTIDYYKIEDNDWIQVVNKSEEMQKIVMKSIFTAKETISIEFSKFETVSNVIDKSIQEIRYKDFVVFLNKIQKQKDKFIYENNIDIKSLVEFGYFKNVNDDYDHIKKVYKIEYINDNDLSRVLREDLQIFQLTKFHPRFIQLFDIYLDNDFVYMKKFLSNKKEISIYNISKWAYQILENVKYLHNHNTILKDMNTMNIWIDENFDIKLTSFNTTEYLNHLNDENKNKYIYGVDQYKPNILTYVAPEILESKPHKSIFHMWSFGVIRNDMIIVSLIIKYDKTKKPKYLTDFIDCCVKRDPKERAKINDLEDLRKGLMKKFLSNNKKKKKGNEISIYDIYQNLEGLKYLHDHNIIMKDMNPMDIWIDGNNDVKLPSFNIIEYLNHLEGDQVIKYMHKPGILTYVAPEILENKPYEASVDVWSLGVIMIEIMTVDELYSELSNDQVVQKIKESHTIKYDKTNTPADLIDFINFCVKGDPKEKDRDPQ